MMKSSVANWHKEWLRVSRMDTQIRGNSTYLTDQWSGKLQNAQRYGWCLCNSCTKQLLLILKWRLEEGTELQNNIWYVLVRKRMYQLPYWRYEILDIFANTHQQRITHRAVKKWPELVDGSYKMDKGSWGILLFFLLLLLIYFLLTLK